MLVTLALFFVRKGVPQSLAKPLAWLSAILGVIALLGLLWGLWTMIVHHHDKGVVNAYENGVQAQVVNEVSAGTNAADAADNKTIVRDAERANQLQEDIGNAVTNHPVEARRSAGPASSAVLDRLRHRPR